MFNFYLLFSVFHCLSLWYRCVPDNERAYALGIQWIVLTLLGAIPGPVLFGIFIDKSCGLWESTCHGQGNCLVYDNEQLSYSLAYVIFIFQGKLFTWFKECCSFLKYMHSTLEIKEFENTCHQCAHFFYLMRWMRIRI